MANIYINIPKIFPNSHKNYKCISDCYGPGVLHTHPYDSNKYILNQYYSTCAIEPVKKKKKKRTKGKKKKEKREKRYFDKCTKLTSDPRNKIYLKNQNMYFCKFLLDRLYGIKTKDQAITFIKNNPYIDLNLKNKILHCVLTM